MIVVTVARKPLAEATVASNAVEYGTGAINVHASRIGTDEIRSMGKAARDLSARHLHQDSRPYVNGLSGEGYPSSLHTGRWPANLILQHQPACEQVGTTRIRAPGQDNSTKHKTFTGDSAVGFGHADGLPYSSHRDADGMETVPVWDCEEGCPIAEMDTVAKQMSEIRCTVSTHPSRYFKQVKP